MNCDLHDTHTHTHIYILLLQCFVDSLAFAKSLQDERCLGLNQEKLMVRLDWGREGEWSRVK